MGHTPQWLLDDWERQQKTDDAQKDRRTVVQLPCCGTSIEVTVSQTGADQYITCPNRHCGKRHLLTWGMKPKLTSEKPRPEL